MEKERESLHPACASCSLDRFKRICITEEGKGSKGCPTLTRVKVLDGVRKDYEDQGVKEFARQASIQEAECYVNRHQQPYIMQPSKTRIIEICEFAKKMGYKRLGLAFCVGLVREAASVENILNIHGFDVVSVLCKAGRVPKAEIGIKEEEMIRRGTNETMCNPIFQARLLNHENTEFNVLLGLCVGHDSLFFKYADAPTTVLAVKDRVTGHNPLAVIYLSESYYTKVKYPEITSG